MNREHMLLGLLPIIGTLASADGPGIDIGHVDAPDALATPEPEYMPGGVSRSERRHMSSGSKPRKLFRA